MKTLLPVIILMALFMNLVIPQGAVAEIIGETDEGVQAIAEPILDNVMKGFSLDDYERYAKDFDETLKETISKERFTDTSRQIKATLGTYIAGEYLGFLNKGKMTVALWKGRFDNTNEDILIKLSISKRGSKYVITGLWFQ